MQISIKYILAFVSGMILLLLINFIGDQKNKSTKVNSGVYPVIYKSIEDKRSLINNMASNETSIGNYKRQLDKVADQVLNLRLTTLQRIDSAAPSTLLLQAQGMRDQLQQAYQDVRPNTYSNYKTPSTVDESINNIYRDISDNFSWLFPALWSPNIYLNADSLSRDNFGQNTLNDIRQFLKDTVLFKNKKVQMNSLIKNKRDELEQLLTGIKEDKNKIEAEITNLNNSLAEVEQSSKDRMLMYVVIPVIGLIVILLMTLPVIYKNNEKILNQLFEQKIILQIFTVFILVMAILLLGIGEKIKGETLGTLLGGVSVYVLQRTLDGKENEK